MPMREKLLQVELTNINLHRLFLPFGAFAYIVWGFYIQHFFPALEDPMAVRVVISSVVLAMWAESIIRPPNSKSLQLKIFFGATLMSLHTGYLLIVNNFSVVHTLGCFVLMAAVYNILTNWKLLSAFTFISILTLGSSTLVNNPIVPASLIWLALFSMLFACFFANYYQTLLLQALSSSEFSKSTILNSMSEGILVKDANGDVVSCNDAVIEMFGQTREQIVGKPVPTSRIPINEDEQPLEPDQMPTTISLKTGKRVHQSIMGLKSTVDGNVRWFSVNAAPVFDETAANGMPSKVIATFEDITELRQNSRIILNQQAMLANTNKLSSLGEMASGIAHEINNPLAVISGKASQISRMIRLGTLNAAEVTPIVDKIQETVQRINQIIVSMRNLSRDGSKDPFEKIQVSKIINDCLLLCKEKLYRSNVIVNVELPADLQIDCRPGQISQILINLIHNAHDAIETNNEKWIQIKGSVQEDHFCIEVTDSGNGIPAKVREKIMQPFFTTKTIGRGTGLGLSISASLAQAHNGLLLYDETCKNTRFILKLPISQKNKIQKAA